MVRRPPMPPEDALARVVLDRYLAVRRGEPVTIEAWSHALAWARALVVEARRRGAVPTLVLEDESAFFRSVLEAGSASVTSAGPGPPGSGAHVYLPGPLETGRLLGLPPDDLARVRERHDARWWIAARRAGTRAVRLALPAATPDAASRFGVDAAVWQAELLRASRVDPRRLEAAGVRLLRSLGRARQLRIRHANGTDLLVRRARRSPFVDTGRPAPGRGRVWGRVPGGLLVLPIDPAGTEGTWETNRPIYDRFARPPLALGGRFVFAGGRLREFGFDRGGNPLADAYAAAGRGRERATALTFGLNPEIYRAPESLELGRGTLGLWVGDGPGPRATAESRFALLAPLGEPDVTADGRRILSGGSAPRPHRG
jgi:hypothetical protein